MSSSTCESTNSTGVNLGNLNSSPQNLLDIKDVVAQIAMRYKGPPGSVESTAWGCGPAPSRLRDGVEKRRKMLVEVVVGCW